MQISTMNSGGKQYLAQERLRKIDGNLSDLLAAHFIYADFFI